MQDYQKQYIENARLIAQLTDLHADFDPDFQQWYEKKHENSHLVRQLKQENNRILNEYFFTMLDDLYNADQKDIEDLEEFADVLMDWKTNLDSGLYTLIHNSLLSMYRVKKDRNNIIKELYKLGMGLYYQDRALQGIENKWKAEFMFRNEMVFTEAGSYIRFFDQIEDEQTKGYIIRALANVALCCQSKSRKVQISSRMLKIVTDDYYRSLAPSLPWDVFADRTWQQLSSTRSVMSRGNMSSEELSEVLEACHHVFERENNSDVKNVRWLWPYYEMEYTCGFVDLQTTMGRMERLIESQSYDQYDTSGLYGNVQLPVYYGRMVRGNPQIQDKKHFDFLNHAYQNMMKTMLTFPPSLMNDYYVYNVTLIITDYFEADGLESYQSVTQKLMQKLSGSLYLKSQRIADLLEAYCAHVYDHDVTFFDDIDFIRQISESDHKRREIISYARECGMYHDFGVIKMNFDRLMNTRNLLDDEFQIYMIHTHAGYDDLIKRKSTEKYADVALGHHSWYNGAGGYPKQYIRNESQYRQMVDIVSVVCYLYENYQGDMDDAVGQILAMEQKQFSPVVTVFLNDQQFREKLKSILDSSDIENYRTLHRQMLQEE